MAKKELKLRAYVSPAETVVVSAYDKDGKAQACTLAFYTPSSHVPPCVTIGIRAWAKRKTLECILEQGAFVVSFPNAEQIKEADYLGVESGFHADKLQNVGFTVSEAKTVHAPIINEMLISLECQLVHKATIGSHMHLTGEIKRIIADDSVLDENDKVVLEKLRPLIYDEEQFRYLGLGEKLSDAFKPGVAMKKELGGNNAG
ncbi:MAG: flavin reductase family protein [Selenomonadaceae bacterium]|nr:flavin reductase family protein [Selenomonadaceae bacterium]MBR4695574.1 flavin reductase family protein [Selenomonadaceae bacterium]